MTKVHCLIAPNKFLPILNLKQNDQYDAIFNTFSSKVTKQQQDIFNFALYRLQYSQAPSKGCLVHVRLLLFFSWVLTSYVLLVTSFAAIGVGKRAIRSIHVKISGRSSLAENTREVRVTVMAPKSAVNVAPLAAPMPATLLIHSPHLDPKCKHVEKMGASSI